MGSFVVGLVMLAITVMGLFLASYSVDVTMVWAGFLFALFGVSYIYSLIVLGTGKKS